jgi:poly-beta-1,6-N-acetyl-D-glucosamine synthase
MNPDRIVPVLASFFNGGILVYSFTITLFYFVIAILSIRNMRRYKQNSIQNDPRLLLSSPMAPSVSLIAPAFNEGKTIIENVRSLLSLHYGNFEVIIVNDGSRDDTLQKLKEHFSLESLDFAYHEHISTRPVLGIYKSRDASYTKLVVVDKLNGGKGDALNAGINIARGRIFACIDVDCILEEDALLKMVKPFMDEEEGKVIATGGVIRIANSCEIVEGKIVKVHLPSSFLLRVQVLEYLRAFYARMGWSEINGLIIISGAFGLFDREIALEAGGYNVHTVGEDMELVVRMRRLMEEKNRKYHVKFVPEPLCWTEAPSTGAMLARQRNRWTRGLIETLWLHKKTLFNSGYGIMGMVSMPFWMLYEWLGPLVELLGVVFFIFFALLGFVNWPFFGALSLLLYLFSVGISVLAIVFEEWLSPKYRRPGDIMRLIATAMLEPFFFHPRMVWWAIKGNYDLLKGNHSWGEITRQGFKKK